jgi:hypothetical protein
MVRFFFRSDRIERKLIMNVGLQDMHTGIALPELLPTTVINFSPEGACLILSKLTINNMHLFYETLNNDSHYLLLYPEDRNDADNQSIITARSVWMDSFEYMDKPAFKVGIRFLQNQKELYNFFQQSSSS